MDFDGLTLVKFKPVPQTRQLPTARVLLRRLLPSHRAQRDNHVVHLRTVL